jgi:hypothetical protein
MGELAAALFGAVRRYVFVRVFVRLATTGMVVVGSYR